jgi:hypothetical protein
MNLTLFSSIVILLPNMKWKKHTPSLRHNWYLERIVLMEVKPEVFALLRTGSFCVALTPVSLCLTTRFLYDIGCKGCQRVEIGHR